MIRVPTEVTVYIDSETGEEYCTVDEVPEEHKEPLLMFAQTRGEIVYIGGMECFPRNCLLAYSETTNPPPAKMMG